MENVTDFIFNIPPGLIDNVSSLAKAIWALGGAIVFYIIFSITNIILNKKRNKKIDEVLKNIRKLSRDLEKIKKSKKK
jgi:uncharacterized protein YoxC|tara:strand:+ start:415 stop:648 length:234 start_codon:yes stop_codon:yes gene_type:complete